MAPLDLRWAAGQLSTCLEVPDRHGNLAKAEARLLAVLPSGAPGDRGWVFRLRFKKRDAWFLRELEPPSAVDACRARS